jgi:hypothetical protein
MLFKVYYFLSLLFVMLLFSACGGGSDSTDTFDVIEENSSQEIILEEENSTSNIEETKSLVYIASSDGEYDRLAIKRDTVEPWEDAMRTDGQSGSYEWWYSDFIFSDGTTVVVSFYSKFLFDTDGSALPLVTINIVYPDGREVNDQDFEFGTVLDASKEFADVHVKSSYLTYEAGNYHLHYSKDNLTFDAIMISELPMWRPETGHIYFGDEGNYFAWLLAQPSSSVQATLEENGIVKELTGSGYHDHNWGNSALHENINNWYWGRADLGEYSLIFSDIISEEAYDYDRVPIVMIAKGNEILDLNGTIEVERSSLVEDAQTGKSYANKLLFTQKDAEGRTYTIESNREKDISFVDMNSLPFDTGTNPTYLRSLSDIVLTIEETNGEKEVYTGMGIVEQISFDANVQNTPLN